MKLATLKDGSRDGRLVVVSRDLSRAVAVPRIAPTLQAALDDWNGAPALLPMRTGELNEGEIARRDAVRSCARAFASAARLPMGRWLRVRQPCRAGAQGARCDDAAEFWTDPLMYQGGSDSFIGPRDDIVFADEACGIDLEAEVAVVTGDVPMGATPAGGGVVDSPADAGQRCEPAQPDSRGARQGLRLLSVQACVRLLAGGGNARRAGRRLARRQGSSAAADASSTTCFSAVPTRAST